MVDNTDLIASLLDPKATVSIKWLAMLRDLRKKVEETP